MQGCIDRRRAWVEVERRVPVHADHGIFNSRLHTTRLRLAIEILQPNELALIE